MIPRILCVLVLGGCAGAFERAGTTGARGAVSELHSTMKASDGAIAQKVAGAAVTGALVSLADPGQQDRLDGVILSVTDAVTRGIALSVRREASAIEQATEGAMQRAVSAATSELAKSLVDGDLRVAIDAFVHDLARSAIADSCSAFSSAFPECAQLDCTRCLEQRISAVARSAAQTASAELAGAVKLPILAAAFLMGVTLALLFVRRRSA